MKTMYREFHSQFDGPEGADGANTQAETPANETAAAAAAEGQE